MAFPQGNHILQLAIKVGSHTGATIRKPAHPLTRPILPFPSQKKENSIGQVWIKIILVSDVSY